MKIAQGISFHPFGDKVYVHSTAQQKDYLLAGNAADVLEFFARNPNTSAQEAAARIAEQFSDDDFAQVQSDVREFVEELRTEGILIEGEASAQTSGSLVKEIERSYVAEHKLFSMSLELTWRCSERCIHCYIDDAKNFCAKDELTLAEYKRILDDATKLGVVRILLTGGEVLLRPDLCDIAEYAVNRGLIVDVYTTGLGMSDEVFDRLCAAAVNSVSFSLYGGTADLHDRITGVKGSFDKTLKAMLMFRSAGVNTFIKSVVMRQNFHGLKKLYELGRRLKIDVNVSPKIASGHDGKCAEDYRLGSPHSYKDFFTLDALFKSNGSRDFVNPQIALPAEGSLCFAGRNSLAIDPFGGVRPCVGFKKAFGSLRRDDLANIWAQMKCFDDLKHSTLTPRCRACPLIRFCRVCVAELYDDETKTFRQCSDEFVMAQGLANLWEQGECVS